jgi:hypothetical protein
MTADGSNQWQWALGRQNLLQDCQNLALLERPDVFEPIADRKKPFCTMESPSSRHRSSCSSLVVSPSRSGGLLSRNQVRGHGVLISTGIFNASLLASIDCTGNTNTESSYENLLRQGVRQNRSMKVGYLRHTGAENKKTDAQLAVLQQAGCDTFLLKMRRAKGRS